VPLWHKVPTKKKVPTRTKVPSPAIGLVERR
jgi:hypothetical protein